MNNPVTEKELIERSTAPRVTEEALNANIKKETFMVYKGGTLTICVLELQNGFTVTGQSACADPANYKPDIGERIAREDAKKKIWAFMGYVLREELYQQGLRGKGDTFLDRMKNEAAELEDKVTKLSAFINGNVQFKELSQYKQQLMHGQLFHMDQYLDSLQKRITEEGRN